MCIRDRRGAASVGAGNDPLIIIDGFPVSSSSTLGSGNRYEAGQTDNTVSYTHLDVYKRQPMFFSIHSLTDAMNFQSKVLVQLTGKFGSSSSILL